MACGADGRADPCRALCPCHVPHVKWYTAAAQEKHRGITLTLRVLFLHSIAKCLHGLCAGCAVLHGLHAAHLMMGKVCEQSGHQG